MLKPIPYLNKQTDFSASDFTQPNYKLWIKKRKDCFENTEDKEVFSPAFVGSLIHENHESLNEPNVIKEFTTIKKLGKHTIGGTIDRLEISSNGSIVICDLKSGGQYPMLKKFKDAEVEDWITQLSVYRWLIDEQFKQIEDFGKIYAFVLGFQKNKDKMQMTWTKAQWLNKNIDSLMNSTIETAMSNEEPKKDCPSWMCGEYCSYSTYCKTRGSKAKEFS